MTKHRISILTLGAIACVSALNAEDAAPPDAHWPQWRGPDFTGAMLDSVTPASWSDGENLKWKVELPGRGHSTPVIWGDRIFLTAAVPAGESGRGRELDFVVLCVDRATGRVVWRQTAKTAVPHEGFHRKYGSFASPSCVVDGERVYAFFGSRGLYCYDLEGEQLWSKEFDHAMRMRNAFGEGTSPSLHRGTLVLHFDDETPDSFIVALDAKSGEERWRAPRDEPSSWTTPIYTEQAGRSEVIVSATNFVRSYDLASGDEIWKCSGLGSNVIPLPVLAHGNVIVMSGHRDPALFAIELGRQGDLSNSDAIKWRIERGVPYTPCSVLVGDDLYMVNRQGMVSSLDTRTGETRFSLRRLPESYSFKASPVATKGKIYLASEQGDVIVLEPADELKVISTVPHEEFFVASPAVAGNELFLRGDKHLYCVAAE